MPTHCNFHEFPSVTHAGHPCLEHQLVLVSSMISVSNALTKFSFGSDVLRHNHKHDHWRASQPGQGCHKGLLAGGVGCDNLQPAPMAGRMKVITTNASS